MEIAKFRGVRTPIPLIGLTIFFWREWLRRRWLPACQNSKRYPHWGVGGVCVKYHPRVIFSFPILSYPILFFMAPNFARVGD